MPIPVICSCSAKLKVGDHLSGKHIKCPKCGALIPVGASNGTGSAPAPAPTPAPAPKASPKVPKGPSTAEVLDQSELADDERERLQTELEEGEHVVWAGKPVAGRAFLFGWGMGSGLIFTAVILVVIRILAAHMIQDTLTQVGMIVAAVILTAAGVAWPFVRRWYATKVVYAVTTRRALVWGPTYFGQIVFNEYAPEDMARLYRVEVMPGKEGIGSIIFGVRVTSKRTREGVVHSHRSYGFFQVRRAAAVEKILRETLVDPYLDQLYE